MAWTAPRTWTTGELVTAAIMNTHIRDNLNVLNPAAAQILIGGTGAEISSGSVMDFEVFTDLSVARWTLMSDVASGLTVEIYAVSYAGAPPASEDSINSGSPATAACARYNQDTNPSAWGSMTGGEIATVDVTGASGITQSTLSLIFDRD